MGPRVLPSLVGPLLTFLALVSFLLRAVEMGEPFSVEGRGEGEAYVWVVWGEGTQGRAPFCFLLSLRPKKKRRPTPRSGETVLQKPQN